MSTTVPEASEDGLEADADAEDEADEALAMADPEEDAADEPAAPARDEAPAASGSGEQGAQAPEATWTVVSNAAVATADVPEPVDGDQPDAAGGGSGPNLAILGVGVLALIGLAYWYRRRS